MKWTVFVEQTKMYFPFIGRKDLLAIQVTKFYESVNILIVISFRLITEINRRFHESVVYLSVSEFINWILIVDSAYKHDEW
jgi:hypothetical protein